MELEELTKSQIVLLVLLVSFVTSIATGIVTVSLLAQAPPAVTQTVNRVIERTVETVVPSENQQASVITKETTVVVKEDDIITQSIDDSFGKIVRIHEGDATSTPIIALGSVVAQGVLVTDSAFVSGEHMVVVGDQAVLYQVNGKISEVGVAVLTPVDSSINAQNFEAIESSALKLGQTLIGLYGARSNRVSIGTLSGRDTLTVSLEEDNETTVGVVETSVTSTLTPGTPLITIFGELAGISTSVSRGEGRGSFVSFGDIVPLVSALTQPEETPEEAAE